MTDERVPPFDVMVRDLEGQLLRQIADRRVTRDAIAQTYARALRYPDDVSWPVVNAAIIDYRSRHALGYIKKHAWRLHETTTGGAM